MTKQLGCVAAAIAVVAGAAHAQSRAKPEDARSAAPPARASAFEGYRPYRDEALAPWREVNDEVGSVGGHSGVVRADRKTAPPPRPSPAQTPETKR
jgi:hypothetical protein